MEELCPKDSGPPPHTHDQDEVIYVMEGELTMILGAEKIRAKAGALEYVSAGCVHSFPNRFAGSTPSQLLPARRVRTSDHRVRRTGEVSRDPAAGPEVARDSLNK